MVSPTGLKRSANHLSAPSVDPKKSKSNGSITSFFGAPKAKPADSKPASSSSFNKDKWVASLTAEQKDLLQLEIDTLDESWLAQLRDEVLTPEFLALKRFLKKEKQAGAKIFPPENEVYSWSRHTPLHKVKAVIVGQDPYHNHNQAHGLCFSVRPPTTVPPSLANIYTGIKNDYPTFQPPPNKGGLLTPWADRGVLMLNTCLTVRAHQANSHSNKGWERFTQKAIDSVAKVRTRGVVFLAWGTPAGKRVAGINREKHCVLQSVHPSPLSAHRGFFNNGHFKKCNDWLAERYGADEVIDWNLTSKKNTELPAATVDKSVVDTPLDSSKSEPASTPTLGDDEKSSPENENQEKEKEQEKEQPPQEDGKTKASEVTEEFEDDPDALEALVTADADS